MQLSRDVFIFEQKSEHSNFQKKTRGNFPHGEKSPHYPRWDLLKPARILTFVLKDFLGHYKWRILHKCSCFIEFIKRVGKSDKMRRLSSILSLLRNGFDKFNNT